MKEFIQEKIMTAVQIQPNNAAIASYYGKLTQLKDEQGVSGEGQTRKAFGDLLEHTAKAKKWTLVEELGRKSTRSSRSVYPDGTLRDQWRLPHGYWEAKDTDDDLDAEIINKRDKGYPLDNIIFEDTERAVLYQDGTEMMDIPLADSEKLAQLLTRFYNHRIAPFEKFDEAVTYFTNVIPEIATGLKERIAEAHQKNKKFQTEFADFLELCRNALNPNLSAAAIDEMLIQHLLTERLIRKIFQGDFRDKNVIANKVEEVIKALTSKLFNRSEFQEKLEPFYVAIEQAAERLASHQERQHFINTVYEQFFQGYSVKVADTHGIVYTPQEIVDFMCAAVEEVLADEFDTKLGRDDVTVLDPCTGTGNFIINLINRVNPKYRRDFYKNHLFANEVMLMPYYIAALNIEHAYYELEGQYESFEGLCFVDTLDLAKKKQMQFSFMTEENTARVQRQQDADITVIIGNPPYNVGQVNENDNNKNRVYDVVDGRIKETYVKDSAATLKTQLYDPYVKFFRWAVDRLNGKDGIVCYVTNNSFVDGLAFDGMRKHLLEDFHRVYHLDLHGNVRQNPKLSGTTHNVFGIQVGVGITIAVRSSKHEDHKLFYHRVPEFWRKEEKLGYLTWNVKEDGTSNALNTVDLEVLQPNEKYTWLVSEYEGEFADFISIGNKKGKLGKDNQIIFGTYSGGVKTNRDAIVYDFDNAALSSRMRQFTDDYNSEIDRYKRTQKGTNVDGFVNYDLLKWDGTLKTALKKQQYANFDENNNRGSIYRPFTKQILYFDSLLINSIYLQHRFFPTPQTEQENRVIWYKVGASWPQFALMVNQIPDLLPESGSQCFPFYVYDADGSNRRENITDWALKQFQEKYGDPSITKWDIFYYVYGLLHHPEYRTRYADNLKRELPRIPFVPKDALTLNPSPNLLRGRRTLMEGENLPQSASQEKDLQDEASVNLPFALWEKGLGDEGKIKQYVSKAMIQISRDLRQRQTPAEVILWEALRNRRLANIKFRRQHPIKGTAFVADFYCHEAKLVIELDGGIHEKQQVEDAHRQAAIEELGYQVSRFPNELVYENLEGVLEKIAGIVSPHPKSLSQSASQERDLQDESEKLPFALWEKGLGDEGGFWAFSRAGKKLADIHLNYEEYPRSDAIEWQETEGQSTHYRVEKMKPQKKRKVPLSQIVGTSNGVSAKEQSFPLRSGGTEGGITVFDTLIYNETLTLTGIPEKAFAYRLGNRSALEWIIDQYRVKIDKRSGIKSDPNGYSEDDQYIVKLVERVVQVSVDTVEIVEGLAKLAFREA